MAERRVTAMSTPIKQTAGWALLAAGILALGPAAAPAGAIDLFEILRLERAGVSEETILKVVEVDQSVFYLSADDIIDLKEAGASEWFIRELMETPERFPDATVDYYYDADPDWTDAYVYDDDDLYSEYRTIGIDDYETVFVHHYYDPFAYYWYPWPRFYVYYSPFWWSRAGFYYAGHWSWDWWDPWSPCYHYCDYRYGWRHHFGPSHTRQRAGRNWHSIDRRATRERDERERTVLRQASLTQPRARIIDDGRTTRSRTLTTRSIDRPSYRSETDRSRIVRRPVTTRSTSSSRARIVRGTTDRSTEQPRKREYRRTERTRSTRSTRSTRTPKAAPEPRRTTTSRPSSPPPSSSRSSSSGSSQSDPPRSRRR
jgi:hypothetical protein